MKKYLMKKATELSFLKEDSIELYVFGSTLYKSNPNDLDILLLYRKEQLSNKYVFEIKEKITLMLEQGIHLPIDILVLSFEEEKEIAFIKNEKAIRLTI